MASGSQNMTTYKAKNARNLLSLDTRASAIEPQSLDANNTALQLDFKQKSITGLTADYSGILSYRPYSSSGDWTGGPAHQIAFDTNGLHWHKSTNSTTWGSWRQLVTIADNTAVGGTTNPIYINASGEAVATSYSLSATVNAASVKNTFAYYSGTNAISSYPRIRNIGSARYPIDIYLYNDAGNAVAELWYDSGDATNFTLGRWNFLAYSPKSTADTATTGKYEYFYLPDPTKDRTSNASYAIRTSKSSAYNVDTATHLSSFPNNTTTFYRGDKTWTNTISNEFKIVRTTTDWKTGATLTFNTTMSSTTGYSYIASYQTPTATSYNDSLVIVATGGCFIGGGEGAETIHQNVMSGSGTEDLYLCPDGSIRIYTGADSKTQRAVIDSTPSFYPATTETGNIGTSSYKWSNMYAVHFNGFATDVGDGSSMWIHPQSSDEINFGGTGGTKIYFGHRDIGSRAKPTDYYFGGTAASATVRATTFIGALSGNASTATTLQTARNINGTSFNGSAAITTANWGTARTLTIGGTGKSVNGGSNVSWSKAEILGSSDATKFYRGDQSWSNTLTGTLILSNTTPIQFNGFGTGTYTCSVFYCDSNGITLETPRASNSTSGAIKPFLVKTRGGNWGTIKCLEVYNGNGAAARLPRMTWGTVHLANRVKYTFAGTQKAGYIDISFGYTYDNPPSVFITDYNGNQNAYGFVAFNQVQNVSRTGCRIVSSLDGDAQNALSGFYIYWVAIGI